MPTLERARLAWRKPDAYDDWDEIVGTLYKSIVIRSIECSCPDEPVLSFPRYGLLYEQYPDVSCIDGGPEPGNIEGFLRFFGFDTIDTPFDTVECCHIDERSRILQEERMRISLNQAVFRCHRRISRNELCLLDSIVVIM